MSATGRPANGTTSRHGPVVWCDGLFLRPQHFQQLERSVHARTDARLAAAGLAAGGFTHLRLDAAALLTGRVDVAAARGVMPDGTPFSVPDDAPAPPALEWPADRRDGFVHLALPLARAGGVDVAWAHTPQAAQARWLAREHAVVDHVLDDTEVAEMALCELQLRLDADPEPAAGLCRLAVARVVERRPGGALVLDEDWIPPCLDCHAVPPLQALLQEASRLLRHRAETLASRWPASAAQVGHAIELPLLQAVNRHDAWLGHLASLDAPPPEALHAMLTQAVGELASFDERRGRRARDLPPWRHADPRASLAVLMAELRLLLADVLEPGIVPLPLQARAPGLWTALVPDAELLRHATFVLVVTSNWPEDTLRRRFPAQAKIGPPDRLRDLVRQHLPAIELRPLSVAPPRLPYRAGACYFALVRDAAQWQALEATRALALHVAGDFPALGLELWAVRA